MNLLFTVCAYFVTADFSEPMYVESNGRPKCCMPFSIRSSHVGTRRAVSLRLNALLFHFFGYGLPY